jgi:sigma-54-specific transcriptional regulator
MPERLLTLPDSPTAPLSIRAKALVFHDPASLRLLLDVERIAHSEATVLVTGETGTGKELIARHIHAVSGRTEPFVAVNCGAFSESLIDAELFGHESGAFTGASQSRAGWFEAANGGTLFLDEIGDLPLALQVKLLRVLQERQVVRLGSRRGIPLDVRLVAATNIDLRRAVEAQHFRADLFYRLSVASVRLPPLRERPADILPLVRHFISVYRQRLNLNEVRVSDRAQEALLAYTWPGNIRELENVIHYALIVCRDHCIEPEDIRLVPLVGASQSADGSRLVVGGLGDPGAALRPSGFALPAHQPSVPAAALPAEPSGDVVQRLQSVLADLLHAGGEALFDTVESTLVHVAFDQAGRNQVRAARLLGITRNVLRTQLKRHGLLGHADDGAALSADDMNEQESLSYPA